MKSFTRLPIVIYAVVDTASITNQGTNDVRNTNKPYNNKTITINGFNPLASQQLPSKTHNLNFTSQPSQQQRLHPMVLFRFIKKANFTAKIR